MQKTIHMIMQSKDYSPSQLAMRLHTLPHLDMTFQKVNATFNPDLYRYREAILFWGIVPIVWMFLTMLVVVMYFCYHCCQRHVTKAGACLKWAMAVLALLSCGAVGAGFYGNEETHKGLQHFIDAAKGINHTTSQTRDQIAWMMVNLNSSVISLTNDLRSNIPKSHALRSEINHQLDLSVRHVTSIVTSVLEIGLKVERIDETIKLVHYAGQFGFYRWLAMVLLLSWMMVLFVILLFAVGKGSKYLMLVFGILSIVSLIICWLSAGFHMGISVGTADFCMTPLTYLEQMSEDKADREIIKYYMKCDHRFEDNPFKLTIPSTYDNAREANNSLKKVHAAFFRITSDQNEREIVRKKMVKIYSGMDATFQRLMHINALVECTNLHKDYIDGISGICFNGLDGMVFLLISIILTGIFFTGVVLLTSGSWRSFTSGRQPEDKNVLRQLGSAMTAPEEGPFIVQPDGTSLNPTYYGNSSKSIRRASDILFRGFLPGFRPNMMGDSNFKKNLAASPLMENTLLPPGLSENCNLPSNSRLHEDNL